MKISRYFWLGMYYVIARYMPKTHSRITGLGGKLRRICAQHLFAYCGEKVNIERMAHFGTGEKIEIGNNSGIGISCRVSSDIKIGDNVMMGPYCNILGSKTHRYDRVDLPMIKQGRVSVGRTVIGDDVWIGQQCLILGGKEIGSHTIIGAGSVVSKNIPEYVVAAGNPIRIIKERKK